MASASLRQTLTERLEWFLSYGTDRASREDLLLIRRARGFGLIGLVIVSLVAGLASFTVEPLIIGSACAFMLLMIAGTLALGLVQEARIVRLFTHVSIGAILSSVFATSFFMARSADTSATFPILLILASCYVLGVRAAVGWTMVAIAGSVLEIFVLAVPVTEDEQVGSARVGLFAVRTIVLLSAMALAAVERRFADRKTAQLEFLARHDELTGLCNRRAFEERAADALARAARYERGVAVLVIDLDGFKAVNDMQGHAAGDEVLRAIGTRIASRTRSTDAACRMGGDEFLVLLEDVSEEKDVVLYAERLVTSLEQPVTFGALPLRVGASVGIAMSPQAGVDPEELTRSADIAMFAAKNAGGSCVHVFEGTTAT